MDLEKLQKWVEFGYEKAALNFLKTGIWSDWWPETQAHATSWVWAIIVQAALELDPENDLPLLLSAPFHGENEDLRFRTDMIEDLWKKNSTREHEACEVLLDFSVHNWDSPFPILMTSESETFAQHGAGASISNIDGYSWDFYKLLVVPSPKRLFFARVGTIRKEKGVERRDSLCKTLKTILEDWGYGKAFLREGDELGIIIIPELASEWKDLRLLTFVDDALIQKKPWENCS